jgi:PAS domain S-box-containing protein
MTKYQNSLLLLVEDDPLQATLTSVRLQKEGYKVVTAHSGEDSIQKVEMYPEITLVIMDIDLGRGMDGTEAARFILDHREIPIVFLTSHSERDFLNKTRDIKRYGYVVKNSGDFLLFSSVEMALDLFFANQELRKKESRFRHITENIKEIFWIEDFDSGKFEFLTRSISNLFGVAMENIGGSPQKAFQNVHPEDRSILESARRELREKQKILECEFRVRIPGDSEIRWVQMRNYPVFNLQGVPIQIVGFAEDVTALKTTSHELRETADRFRLMFQFMPSACMFVDTQFTALEWNPAAEAVFGYSREEVLNRPVLEKIVPKDALDQVSGIPDLIDDATQIIKNVNWNIHKNKKRMLCEWNNAVVRNESNQVIGMICMAEDITQKVISDQALRNSEEKYRLLAENTQDLITIQDSDGLLTYVSPSSEKIIGYPAGKLIGKKIYDIIYPEDKKNLKKKWIEAMRGKDVIVEYRVIDPEGSLIWLEAKSKPFFDPKNNHFSEMQTASRDISERKKWEMLMKGLVLEKETLLKEVHHRVKNNMSTIASLLSLQAGTLENLEAKEILLDAKNRVSSMMIIYDKLFGSKTYQRASLSEYLTTLIQEISVAGKAENISIQADIEDIELQAATLFPVGIIINELVTNSLKHAFQGRANGYIKIKGQKIDNDTYLCVVKDNGVGTEFYPDGDLDSLGQDRDQILSQGSGFGLQLVQILIDQIQGSFQQKIEPNHGALLSFRFPTRFDWKESDKKS